MAGGSILELNPSLIGYMGGGGRAAVALGRSINDIGQTKLDLAKQKQDQSDKQVQLDLMTNADTRAADAVKLAATDKVEKKQDTFNENVANNSYLYKAMGLNVPGELTNEHAALGLQDPKITALGIKESKDKYSGTAGGIIFNTGTGQVAGDYRDKTSSKELDGLPSIRSIVGGKERVTYFNTDGSPKLRIDGDGTPISTYGQYVADNIGDINTAQRPNITNNTTQEISGVNAIRKGGMPIKFDANPKVAAEQKKWALPIEGGGWYVPSSMTEKYKQAFPR